MPLPDAPDYSKRIYELLKETDLENLTYSQFQGVAEKLFIEPENEDEMRRLVLVQLARMAVRGDWDGFLTGGGGGGGAPTDAEYVVMALNGTLTNERKLTAGSRITITDGGAGGNVTIAADASPVTSLVAGTNITLSPVSGLGDVTITAATPAGLAPNDASYLTLGLDGDLTNERVLTAGTGISFTDTGANGTLTIETTGGSSVYKPVLPNTDIDTTGRDDLYMISRFPPWGSNSTSTSSTTATNSPQYRPFVSPRSGDILSIVMNVNSNTDEPNYDIGIYSDSNGFPDTLLGKATAALTTAEGTGTITLTPSTTITTVAGTQYHLGWVRTSVAGAGNFTAETNGALFWVGPISPNYPNLASLNQMVTIIEGSSDNVLPTNPTATNCEMTYNNPPRWGLVWS